MSIPMKLHVAVSLALLVTPAAAETLTGAAAFGDWHADAPGVTRLIRPGDLPRPDTGAPSSAWARIVNAPADANLHVPPGFSVALFATGLRGARTLRYAPNGDLFVAQTAEGQISIIRPTQDSGKPAETRIFARGFDGPFGLAFYPPGRNPKWLYVASTTLVVRFAYKSGDLAASGPSETIVKGLPDGGHSTRDIVFSRDGLRMFVSVGSQTNIGEEMGNVPHDLAAFEKSHATGATWGSEEGRADVLSFKPDGSDRRIFATGLRNCVGMTLAPQSDRLWCVVNERDLMGDDVPPDYATSVEEGAFYGWPWFYIGAHPEPRLLSRPALADKVRVPDVLIQAHSAALGIVFYEGRQFPAAYQGDAFVALHGSWNRTKRTGYKIVRLRFDQGKPTGAYEDFVTGFVLDDTSVFGRPVAVAVAPDGSLMFSEDGNGTIWRVTATGGETR
jgi:glucose/arabinose dehydrogenase